MPLEVRETAIEGVKVLVPMRHRDPRGVFSETYNARDLLAAGIDLDFVQDNFSMSRGRGVVRGLHFQRPPAGQAKLVRVHRGTVFDVAVDIRVGSPTFGQHVSMTLSAEAWNQVFIPEGFAHGFCTLEPDTEVIYKASGYYAPDLDAGIAWDDPALAIDWPVKAGQAFLSDKDRGLPRLADLTPAFTYTAKTEPVPA